MAVHWELTFYAAIWALPALCAASGPDPVRVWNQAVTKAAASAHQERNYTCVETVERRSYMPPRKRTSLDVCPGRVPLKDPAQISSLSLWMVDRLRLDVGISHGGELYSLPGASSFVEGGIDSVIRDGPIGTGSFGSFLNMILWRDSRDFLYAGQRHIGAAVSLEYTFRVPKSQSHYLVKTKDSWVQTGYFGSIFVDARKSEIVRLTIETTDPDADSGSCQSRSTLDFDAVEGVPFRLPLHGRQLFLRSDGSLTVNTTTFAQCREYLGESTLRFELPDVSPPGTDVPPKFTPIAPGLNFQLELIDRIDTATAAAGDHFRARLRGELRDVLGNVQARDGAIVEGRIRRMEVFERGAIVVLAPRAVLAGGDRLALAANRDWTGVSGGVLVPSAGEQPAGVFRVPGAHPSLKPGFLSRRRTVEATTK